MAKVIMTCGRICSGKSSYAQKLRAELGAVILSVDEITLSLFGQNAGDKHDEYVEKTEKYLFDKSVEIIATGINVILDWGFWTKAERTAAKDFYRSRNIECEFHYLDISDELWHERIEKRNRAVSAGETEAYYVDENLAKKFGAIFEPPDDTELKLRLTICK